MAGDQEFDIKIVIYPFQEMRKKKLAPMQTKEIGMKKPKNFEFKDKFTVTSVKWNKKKIEDAAKTMFRYDLSLLGAQMWENFVPIEKAKNGQDKMKATKAFTKIVPELLKRTEKKLQQSFAEFKEDVASGASDDLGELKGTRKSLTAGHPEAMSKAAADFLDGFEESFNKMEKVKKLETKSSGEAKAKATEELEDLIKSEIPDLAKKLAQLISVLKKRVGVLTSVPAAMKKSMNKDMSDSAKAEFKTAMDLLSKATSPVESQVTRFGKAAIASLDKMKRKDLSAGVFNATIGACSDFNGAASKLEDVMSRIDNKMKKLEQTAKKR